MRSLILIVTGADDSGKEKLVAGISEIPVIEVPQAGTSNGSTVAISFGRLALSEDLFLYLVALPPEETYRFLWHRAQADLVGFVMVHDVGSGKISETAKAIEVIAGYVDAPWVLAPHSVPGGKDTKTMAAKLSLDSKVAVVTWRLGDKESARKVVATVLAKAKETV